MNNINESIPEIKIKKIALGISLFIFLGTLPYWLIDRDSKLSIINMLISNALGKHGDIKIDAEASQSLEWAKFYLHMIFTSIGLLIYIFTNASRNIGFNLSRSNFAKYFQSENHRKTIKGITLIIFVVSVYLLFVHLIEHKNPPVQQFNLAMIILICLSIVWHFGDTVFEKILSSDEKYDFSKLVKLVTLGNTQIAYLNKNLEDSWLLCLPDKKTDMSYSESYIFDFNRFNHHYTDVTILEEDFGIIKANISLVVKPVNFPDKISISQIHMMLGLISEHRFRELIYNLLNTEQLSKQLKEYYQKIKKFNNDSNINFELESTETFNELVDKITTAISAEHFKQQINEGLLDVFLNQNAFNIKFSITKNSIKESLDILSEDYDARKREARKDERLKKDENEKAYRDANIETRKELNKALIDMMKTLPKSQRHEIINLIAELEYNPSKQLQNKAIQILEASTVKNHNQLESNDFKKTVSKISLTLSHYTSDEATKDDIDEELSKCCANYFDNNNLSVDKFTNELYSKWEYDKEPKDEPLIKQLVEDVLLNLINQK